MKGDVEKLRREKEDWKRRAETEGKRKEALDRDLEQSNTVIADSKREIDRLRAKLRNGERDRDQLRVRLEKAEKEREGQDTRLEQATRQRDEARGDKEKVGNQKDKKIKKLRADIDSLVEEVLQVLETPYGVEVPTELPTLAAYSHGDTIRAAHAKLEA